MTWKVHHQLDHRKGEPLDCLSVRTVFRYSRYPWLFLFSSNLYFAPSRLSFSLSISHLGNCLSPPFCLLHPALFSQTRKQRLWWCQTSKVQIACPFSEILQNMLSIIETNSNQWLSQVCFWEPSRLAGWRQVQHWSRPWMSEEAS